MASEVQKAEGIFQCVLTIASHHPALAVTLLMRTPRKADPAAACLTSPPIRERRPLSTWSNPCSQPRLVGRPVPGGGHDAIASPSTPCCPLSFELFPLEVP